MVKAESTKTAAEFINQAHKHDNMYASDSESDQQKALRFYESALAEGPDEKQRLHILYRMGQLYGSAYQLEKGEKPDFHKAISLYKKIVDSYPPEEPLVYKAMSSLCDHYTTLRDFETALGWSKKVLEYNTTEQLESGGINRKSIDRVRRYQRIAVDQVAYTANHIDYLRTHGELRAIADKYYGTFIAERASELLAENMDKMPDLWSPQNDFPLPENSTLQAHSPVPAAFNQIPKDI